MPPDPGEPLEKITLNVFRRDMALLRARYPRGGHLTFIQRLLRAWADAERMGGITDGENSLEEAIGPEVSDEAVETLKSLARRFP